MKSGNLNFLEHSGPLQACKGTALPFTNEMQHKAVYLLFCKFTLHVSGVKHPSSGVHKTVTTASGTGHVFFVQLPPSNVVKLATLEGVAAQKI